MKKIAYSAVILIGLFITSCAPDKKDDPNTTEPTATDARDKFVANWSVTENSKGNPTPTTHTVNITKSGSSANAIIIENFYGLNTYTVSANVNGSTFTIPSQPVKDNVSSTIGYAAGSGTLTTSTHINLTYTTAIATNHDTCTAVYYK